MLILLWASALISAVWSFPASAASTAVAADTVPRNSAIDMSELPFFKMLKAFILISFTAMLTCDIYDRHPCMIPNIEVLCRYVIRPAITNERLSVNRAGQVVLKLKTAWRNGTTHIVMSLLEFMQRLAALVPRSRLRLIHFHGVLAPNARLRSAVVPVTAQTATGHLHEGECAHAHSAPVRMSWARLLKRVFDLDIEHCKACSGKLKIIAVPSTSSGQGLKSQR